jgi:F420H(2)-dependent quinone reductase
MRFAGRILGAVVALLVLAMGLSFVASESGEVVVLKTKSANAAQPDHETRVWVVDDGGKQWLRAGDPHSTWLLAIQRDPLVEVVRGEKSAAYTAVPDVAARDRMNALFAEKYGWADRYVAMLFGRDDATPIRLDPR